MRGLSTELKLIAIVVAVVVGLSLVSAQAVSLTFERRVEQGGHQALSGAAEAFAAQERSDIEKLSSTLDALMSNDALRHAYLARDRSALLAVARPLFERLKVRDRITHWYFIDGDPTREVFLRVHKPELFGDRVERATLAQAIQSGDMGAGKELGQTAFALRVVRPWVVDGQVIGYLELAEEIDHFLVNLKARTGDDYGLLVVKKFLDQATWARVTGARSNTWNDRPDVVVVDTTSFTDGIIDFQGDVESLPDAGLSLDEIERGDRAYVRGIFPVRDAAGRKVGGLFVLHDFTGMHRAMRSGAVTSTIFTGTIALFAAAVVLLAVRRLVFDRLDRLRRELAARVEELELPEGRLVRPESKDEVDRLEALVERLLYPVRSRLPPATGRAPPSGQGGVGAG